MDNNLKMALSRLGIDNKSKIDNMTKFEKSKILNSRLKEITTYDELRELLDDCKNLFIDAIGFNYVASKRSGAEAFSFTHMYTDTKLDGSPFYGITDNEKYKNRVHYLYDGISEEGSCYVKDIHRYLKIVVI